MKNIISTQSFVVIFASAVFLAGLAAARGDDQVAQTTAPTNPAASAAADQTPVAAAAAIAAAPATAAVTTTLVQSDADADSAPRLAQDENTITIQTYEPDGKKKPAKEVAWLGVVATDSTEVLSAQLGLKPGEGLTVHFLAPDGPAAKAGFHKNDVLAEMDGQMLVDPMQLRKLVRMHAEGDTVKLTYYRGGKKQTLAVKLGKTTSADAYDMGEKGWPGDMQDFKLQFQGLQDQFRGMGDMARASVDKAKIDRELKRTLEETRKAIQDAVRQASSERQSLDSVNRELEALVRGGVDVDKDATVIVRDKRKSNRTMVQTDETGSYNIVEAGGKTHATARDKNGKLLFEGEIDTPAERQKVPKDVWEKLEPMFDEISTPTPDEPKSWGGGKSDGRGESEGGGGGAQEKPNSRNNLRFVESYLCG
jgi:hypothetical protein